MYHVTDRATAWDDACSVLSFVLLIPFAACLWLIAPVAALIAALLYAFGNFPAAAVAFGTCLIALAVARLAAYLNDLLFRI